MSTAGQNEQIPQAILINTPWEEAAAFLEQAAKLGKLTPELAYMLGICYKRDGKLGEARAAFRKIIPPDTNVLLQLGLLSFAENQFAQAAEEFQQSLQKDENSYAACYNLLLCRLQLGQLPECQELLPKVIALAPSEEDKRLLILLEELLNQQPAHGSPSAVSAQDISLANNGETVQAPSLLATITPEEEQQLLLLLQGIDNPELLYPLLQNLVSCRPESTVIQRTYLELGLLQAKQFADRYHWQDAEKLLSSITRLAESPALASDPGTASLRVALLNLKGVCACVLQEFDRAGQYFSSALRLASNKTWLNQNLAITCELMGKLDQAEIYWNRYFDLLDSRTPVPPIPNYLDSLAFAGLCRLGELYSKHDRLNNAINFFQRAHLKRPRDVETLEKLFQFYVQSRRNEDARRMLRKLRELRPNEPQFELYELDLVEVRGMEDLDRILAEIKRIVSRHPGDMRVEDRALHTVANCIPLISRKSDQLSDQLANIVEQVRRLPNYQINWPVVHDEMRFLRLEFQKLRKLCNKALAVVSSEEHRRMIRDLNHHIDSKIDICVSMGG